MIVFYLFRAQVLFVFAVSFMYWSGSELHSQNTLNGRIFFGALVDDNVRELPSSTWAAGSALSGTLSFRSTARQSKIGTDYAQVQIQSGNSVYPTRWKDSRTLTQATAKYCFYVSRGFRLLPFGRMEVKNFVQRDINYRTGSLGLQAALSLPGDVSVSIETWRSKVVFSAHDEFNNLADVITLSAGKNFSSIEYLSVKAMAGNHQYAKNAISPQGSTLAIRQRDHTFGYGASFELFRWNILIQANYLYMIVASNSYGSSLSTHKIDAMMLRKLWSGVFLKIHGSTEFRNYRNEEFVARDVSTYQLGLDNKAFTVELGKPISDHFEIKLRLHWYNNQALLKTEYYERTVLVAGIERKI